MSLSVSSFKQILYANVVELRFVRRRKVKDRPPTRRMLGSLNLNILNSDQGRLIFNFKLPSSSKAYNFEQKNLVSVFDLFMQDWRTVPVDSAEIINIIPCSPQEKFWDYFNEILVKMTAEQKALFLDS
jgi:hypothetical protein